MKEDFEKNKKNLMKLSLDGDLTNGALMYNLIKSNNIDHLILRMNKVKTYTNTNSIVKKGYLTAEEQFLNILNNFISIYEKDFCFVGNCKKMLLEIILKNKKKNLFFLCKHYWGG